MPPKKPMSNKMGITSQSDARLNRISKQITPPSAAERQALRAWESRRSSGISPQEANKAADKAMSMAEKRFEAARAKISASDKKLTQATKKFLEAKGSPTAAKLPKAQATPTKGPSQPSVKVPEIKYLGKDKAPKKAVVRGSTPPKFTRSSNIQDDMGRDLRITNTLPKSATKLTKGSSSGGRSVGGGGAAGGMGPGRGVIRQPRP
jgi:hypothetical protein